MEMNIKSWQDVKSFLEFKLEVCLCSKPIVLFVEDFGLSLEWQDENKFCDKVVRIRKPDKEDNIVIELHNNRRGEHKEREISLFEFGNEFDEVICPWITDQDYKGNLINT